MSFDLDEDHHDLDDEKRGEASRSLYSHILTLSLELIRLLGTAKDDDRKAIIRDSLNMLESDRLSPQRSMLQVYQLDKVKY
jgi:hypothetical protein